MTTHSFRRMLCVAAVVSLAATAGCGGGSESPPPAPTSLTVSELVGVWLTGCQPDTRDGEPTSRLTAVRITADGGITFHEYSWNSDTCDGDVALFARNIGTLSLTGGDVSTGFGTASRADIVAAEQWLTVFDAGLLARFNADDAYNRAPWEAGVSQEVTGLNYEGNPSGGVMHTLLLRSGETLFVGDEDTIDESGYPTQVQAEVGRVSSVPVTTAALEGQWSAPCRGDNRSEFASQASVSRFDISGSTIGLTTTYYDTPSCDTNGVATPMARETMTFTAAMHAAGTVLTERGLATAGDLTLTAHTLTPLDADGIVAGNLNDANSGNGAYLYNDWSTGVPVDVFALGVEYDGSAQVISVKMSAVTREGAFFVHGGESSQQVPQNGAGYPYIVGAGAFLRNHLIEDMTDLDGTWYEPCRHTELWGTAEVAVSDTALTRRAWSYSDESTCAGTATLYATDEYTASVEGSVATDRGTAYQVQLQPEVGNPFCALIMRIGDRLYASEPNEAAGANCVDEYASDVGDTFSYKEVTPITTVPLSTFRSPCRQEPGGDWVETYLFLGNGIGLSTLHFLAESGCTGSVTSSERDTAKVALGSVTPVPEGTATRIVLTSQTGEAMKQVVKWMRELFWFGDDAGPLEDGYPTTLIPGHGATRIY